MPDPVQPSAEDAPDVEQIDTDPEDELTKARRHARHYERESRKSSSRIAALEAQIAELQQVGQSESEKAVAAAVAQARQETESAWRERFNRVAVQHAAERALAGKVSINPATALRLLDLSQVDVDEDGKVDQQALDSAVEDLLGELGELATPKSNGRSDLGARRQVVKAGQSSNDIWRAALRGT